MSKQKKPTTADEVKERKARSMGFKNWKHLIDASICVEALFDEVLEEYAALRNQEQSDLIKQLLMFCEVDGEVCNGFRTKEIILQLKAGIEPPKQ